MSGRNQKKSSNRPAPAAISQWPGGIRQDFRDPGDSSCHPSAARWTEAGISLSLMALVWFVFGQVVRFGFVNYDDNLYITDNTLVQSGVTAKGILWAFKYEGIGHWHPLTWLSHMLDCRFYGLWAGGHHLTNVLLHGASAVCLFFVLWRMTGARWRAVLVAALWAIHPLHVESVAWISERKDVLSGLLFILTLGAYVRYARNPSVWGYAAVLAIMGLGLLAKDMLVTIPFVLLLLDYWPLRRMTRQTGFRLLLEKAPLLALSAASCLITVLGPEEIPADTVAPIAVRLENAVLSYMAYLWQTIWPAGMATPYVYPRTPSPLWEILLAAVVLLGGCAAAIMARKKAPAFFVGWFWFLGMLVPVIGLVQISYYPRADRYTYLPHIGLFIAVTWGAAALAGRLRIPHWLVWTFSLGTIAGLAVVARTQTAFWRDNETLWRHTLAYTQDNWLADNNLGAALSDEGRDGDAAQYLHAALRIRPSYGDALCGLAVIDERAGRKGEAMSLYRQAIASKPPVAQAYNNLGYALAESGQLDEAIAHYEKAIEIKPGYLDAHYNLGVALQDKGDTGEAIAQFQEALDISPRDVQALNNLGTALEDKGDVEGAIAQFGKALEINPNYAIANNNLGDALQRNGDLDGAIATYQKTLGMDPANADACYNLGVAIKQKGDAAQALGYFTTAVKLKPDFMEAQANLAELLATAPDARLRDGAQAEAHAQRADELSGGKNPVVLGILASAYAEQGHYAQAVAVVKQAIQYAQAQGNTGLAGALQEDLELYAQGKPLRNP